MGTGILGAVHKMYSVVLAPFGADFSDWKSGIIPLVFFTRV